MSELVHVKMKFNITFQINLTVASVFTRHQSRLERFAFYTTKYQLNTLKSKSLKKWVANSFCSLDCTSVSLGK